MILGTKNAPGRSETDIGGPCQKPYINVTFWDNFLRSRSGKTSSGVKKVISMEILSFSPFWSDRSGPGRLRNLNIPIGILRFPARAGQGSLRTSKIWFCIKISGNFMKLPKILVWNQYFHEKSDLAVPGEKYEHYNHWKSTGNTVFFACQRCGAEILRNARKSWKFMKFHKNWKKIGYRLHVQNYRDFSWILNCKTT